MERTGKETGKYYQYLDVLRVIAICLVIFTHSGIFGIHSYTKCEVSSFKYFVYVFLAPLSQCSVNIFFMISGVLLLGKEESLKKLFSHRILRFFLSLSLFVFVTMIFDLVKYGTRPTVLGFFKDVYQGGNLTQQWFLFSYLSLLFILPFLRKMVKTLTKAEYLYLVVLMIVFKILCPMFEAVFDWNACGIGIPVLENILFYPLLGYGMFLFAQEYLSNRNMLFAGGFGVVLLIGQMLMNHHSFVNGEKLAYLNLFTPIYCIIIFALAMGLFGKKPSVKKEKFWKFCGNGVFGTYIFENILEELFRPGFVKVFGEYGSLFGLLCWIVAIVTLGICISNLLKKIPGIKNVL